MILDKECQKEFQELKEKFMSEIIYAGIFVDPYYEKQLKELASHENIPKDGFHVTKWFHTNELSDGNFVSLITTPRENVVLDVAGYGDNGYNQGLSVYDNFPGMGNKTPHITISWSPDSKPVKTGNIPFSNLVFIPEELQHKIPEHLTGYIAGLNKDGKIVDFSEYEKAYWDIKDKCTSYVVSEVYDVDGGFGDAISKSKPLFVTDNRAIAETFKKEYNNPYVYDVPYSSLLKNEIKITEIPKIPTMEKLAEINGKDFGLLNKEEVKEIKNAPDYKGKEDFDESFDEI